MLTDRYGLTVSTTSSVARDAYIEGCDLIFSGNLGPADAFQRAIDADPHFTLAHAGKARAHQLRGEASAARDAMAVANAVATKLTEREISTMAYYNLVLSGQGDAAVVAAKEHLRSWPRDAMVLNPCTSVFGLIGFSGRAGREREQVELMDSLAPHYGDDWWFNSQHAFALDEVGQRSAARRRIDKVMSTHPRHAHGAHIRAHVYYEDGEQAASLAYLRGVLADYPLQAQLYCHISWHIALCELDAGNTDAAWAMFDQGVDPDVIWGPPINALTDAVAFLWRAELSGGRRDPARWAKVHDFAHRMFPHAGIAFSDTHILLTDAVIGDTIGFEARLAELAEREQQDKLPSGPVVPALARGFFAFAREDWNAAIAAIEPVFAQHERIGGSRAQRDLVDFTLLKAYLNAGRDDDARRFLDHRREGPRGVPVAGVAALH